MNSQKMCGKVRRIAFRGAVVVALTALAALVLTAGQQGSAPVPYGAQSPVPPRPFPQSQSSSPPLPVAPPLNNPLTLKQKSAIVNANFKSTKHDVEKLSKLVQTLDDELKKSNPDVLSLSIVKQTDKIAKLARKIKNEAKSY
ncbi:MAG: hypothetical protein ACRD06_02035 [Terriglobia bacterium]